MLPVPPRGCSRRPQSRVLVAILLGTAAFVAWAGVEAFVGPGRRDDGTFLQVNRAGATARHGAAGLPPGSGGGPAEEAAAAPAPPARSGQSKLLNEVMTNTPGLARSSPAGGEPSDGGGGIRFLVAPRPSESVNFALWFGPLPCFQVGTFRICL